MASEYTRSGFNKKYNKTLFQIMETFRVYQQGQSGMQAVREQIQDFLLDIKIICSNALFNEIKLGLTSITNQIGSVTVKKPQVRIVKTQRIIPTTCPEMVPLYITFDIIDKNINGEIKTLLTFSSYLDLEITGDTKHLDEYIKTIILKSKISTQEKMKIDRYAQRPDNQILIPYRTIIFQSEECFLIPYTFKNTGPYFFADSKHNLQQGKEPLQVIVNLDTFYEIPKEVRMRKTPDFIYAGTERRIDPNLGTMTNLFVSYLILQKIDIRNTRQWGQAMSDVNKLPIPIPSKIQLFEGVRYNLSRKLLAEKPTLSEIQYAYLQIQLDGFLEVEFQPIATI